MSGETSAVHYKVVRTHGRKGASFSVPLDKGRGVVSLLCYERVFRSNCAFKRTIKALRQLWATYRARNSAIGLPTAKTPSMPLSILSRTSTMLYGCVNGAEPAAVPAKRLMPGQSAIRIEECAIKASAALCRRKTRL